MGPPSGWFWGSLFSQLYEWRSTALISLDRRLVPSNCYLIWKLKLAICAPGDTYRNAQRSIARHGQIPKAQGRHKFPAHLPFRLLLLGEICVLHTGVESSKLDSLQSVTMPFYNNGAFTSCRALGLSTWCMLTHLSFQQPCEVGTVIILILQMRKMRNKMAK